MYQCKFTAIGGSYAMDKYDLNTACENKIRRLLEIDGWDVIEIYDIKKQS